MQSVVSILLLSLLCLLTKGMTWLQITIFVVLRCTSFLRCKQGIGSFPCTYFCSFTTCQVNKTVLSRLTNCMHFSHLCNVWDGHFPSGCFSWDVFQRYAIHCVCMRLFEKRSDVQKGTARVYDKVVMALSLVSLCEVLDFLGMYTLAVIYDVTFFIIWFLLFTKNDRRYRRIPWVALITSAEKHILWYTVKDHGLIFFDFSTVVLESIFYSDANWKTVLPIMFHDTIQRSCMIRNGYLNHIASYKYLI